MPEDLKSLVFILKSAVSEQQLTEKVILKAIRNLQKLDHKIYDSNKFPKLENTSSFDDVVGPTPTTLAEALLWKLGKWPTYKTFVENYSAKDLEVSKNGGIVFSAFAKHLQNNDYPIFDQHAIRAIWAICDLRDNERTLCQAWLLNKTGSWKPVGSGGDGSCYKLFVDYVDKICGKNNVNNRTLDLLLMPLGQALKKETSKKIVSADIKSDFEKFEALCWDIND